jgi:plastin-1
LSDEEVKKAGMMEDDVGDSREERVFRLWMNSLGLEDFYVNSLWEDCKDGIAILKVEDYVEPGCVTWSKVEMKPANKFKKLSNCNYAVVIGKSMKFSMVTTDGNDFVTGNRKLLLGFIWQLMRLHTFKILAKVQEKKFGGKTINDDMLVTWANESIAAAKRDSKIKSFQDGSMSSGVFFLDLLHALEPKVIDWSLAKEGKNQEEGLSNCKYAISIARKLGATIFCLPEDLQEVKPKMIMTFVASLMSLPEKKS